MTPLLSYLKEQNISHYQDRDISPYLSMRVGGKVSLIILAKSAAELKNITLRLNDASYPYVVLGGGSNVVFPSEYSPIGVVINRSSGITKESETLIRTDSGASNSHLINWCIHNQFSGLEFLAGIPGTIGGAAAVNAGAFQKSMADILEKAEVLDTGNQIKIVEPDYFQYGYRDSVFRTGNQVILNLSLRLSPGQSRDIQKQVDNHLAYRRINHPPYSQFTAGCFFKNPVKRDRRISAGKIIEDLEFKGHHFNKLRLSDKHANFMINKGGARLEDIRAAEREIIRRAASQKGIRLEREVIYITPGGEKQ